jgi:Ca2+-binding RTX toxin-like protein
VDTILTTLNSFVLDDAAPAGDARISSDASPPLIANDAGHRGATPAVATTDDVSSEVATSEAATSDLAPADPLGELDDFGSAANVENLTYLGDGSFIGIGNSSDNVLIGGRGNDVLRGEGGDDVLYGGDGDDVLDGGHGNDRFDAGPGDDVLYLASGGRGYGNDTIVLKPGFGSDVVIGFDANDCHSQGHDRLDVSAYTSLSEDSIGAEIQITGIGPHTVITINGDSVTLLDVSANTIGKDDFIFS